ncbi:MAG: AAA family ATPase [Bradymonadaceae bacterium]|nr:AAA family ATPase [Lujinxingiaceae bacterium]
MKLEVSISSLPLALTYDQAVEAAYRDDLDWIEEKLRQRLSVLVECDKQLTNYIYLALRRRFRAAPLDPSRSTPSLQLLAGQPRPPAPGEDGLALAQPLPPLPQRLLDELREVVYSAENSAIVVLSHLDILTTTTRSGLNVEAREAAAIMYENPDIVYLGFRDPGFEIPPVIEKVFAVKHAVVGLGRERLASLVLQQEARKLGVDTFNPFALFKYVSGLNAVRCRQILSQLAGRIDFDPAMPASRDAIYRDIRRMTVVGDLEIPQVDLDRHIGGYDDVKARIKTEILELLAIKEGCTAGEQVREIEEIIPKGMIFYGPPGTGKTFFAKAIATALNATVSVVSGPELKSKWVGESEENLRRVFAQARRSAPAIIIFDELDSFASARGTYTGSGVEHSMVNQLLTEMDGFRKEELVFVVGTTNFVSSLDPALLRPGRFELMIEIPYPDAPARRAIVDIYRKQFALEMSEDIVDYVVEQTAGYVDAQGARYSGDHIYAILRALKREALRRGTERMAVGVEDVDRAIGDRRQARRPRIQKEEEHTIAIHEAGHAVAAWVLPNCPAVQKITIATGEDDHLGYVLQEIARNQFVHTRSELLDDICVALAGREAEAMVLGDISSGAWGDLQRATALARMMVEQWGMDESLPLRSYGGGDDSEGRALAPATAERLDMAIGQLLETQQARARHTLEQHRGALDELVKRLLAEKTLTGEHLREVFGEVEFKRVSATAELV